MVAAGAAAVTLQAASVARQIGAAVAGCDGQQQQQHQQQLGDVERQAGEAADAVRPVNGWFNMVLSDTLPTLRDPITQQVQALAVNSHCDLLHDTSAETHGNNM